MPRGDDDDLHPWGWHCLLGYDACPVAGLGVGERGGPRTPSSLSTWRALVGSTYLYLSSWEARMGSPKEKRVGLGKPKSWRKGSPGEVKEPVVFRKYWRKTMGEKGKAIRRKRKGRRRWMGEGDRPRDNSQPGPFANSEECWPCLPAAFVSPTRQASPGMCLDSVGGAPCRSWCSLFNASAGGLSINGHNFKII